MATYGEQLLARSEAKVRSQAARRRALALMVPGALTVVWSTMDLVGARSDRLDAIGAGTLRHIVDPVLPIVWTALFVLLPLIAAVKPQPLPAGAALAVVAGPIMTPVLFGAGGWKPWQIAFVFAIAVLVIGAAVERSRRFPLD